MWQIDSLNALVFRVGSFRPQDHCSRRTDAHVDNCRVARHVECFVGVLRNKVAPRTVPLHQRVIQRLAEASRDRIANAARQWRPLAQRRLFVRWMAVQRLAAVDNITLDRNLNNNWKKKTMWDDISFRNDLPKQKRKILPIVEHLFEHYIDIDCWYYIIDIEFVWLKKK